MAGAIAPTRGITRARGPNAFLTARPLELGVFRILSMCLSTVSAAPLSLLNHYQHPSPEDEDVSMWVLYVSSVVLVLLGGAFAGLTIA